MNNSYTLIFEDNPHPNDTNFIRERLAEYNRRQVGSDNHKALAIFLKLAGKSPEGIGLSQLPDGCLVQAGGP